MINDNQGRTVVQFILHNLHSSIIKTYRKNRAVLLHITFFPVVPIEHLFDKYITNQQGHLEGGNGGNLPRPQTQAGGGGGADSRGTDSGGGGLGGTRKLLNPGHKKS